jgi:hypothetical protein
MGEVGRGTNRVFASASPESTFAPPAEKWILGFSAKNATRRERNRVFRGASPESTFHFPNTSQKWILGFSRKNATSAHDLACLNT